MKLLALMTVFSFALPVLASPGGSDFCGLGWSITQKKSFAATSTRSTTNAFVPPSFGMTTGTINCDQHSLVKRDVDAAQYVAGNYDVLMNEIVQGNGEFVSGLGRVMGCSEASLPEFRSTTKDGYEDLQKNHSANPIQFIQGVKSHLRKNNVCATI